MAISNETLAAAEVLMISVLLENVCPLESVLTSSLVIQ